MAASRQPKQEAHAYAKRIRERLPGGGHPAVSNCAPLPRTSLEPVCVALAAVIRRRRERVGLSLNQLAVQTQISRQMLSFVERGRRIPTVDTVARVSRAFGVPLSVLIAEAEQGEGTIVA